MEDIYLDYLISLANNCAKKDMIYEIKLTNKNDSLFYSYFCGKYSIDFNKDYGDINFVNLGPYDEVTIDFSSSPPSLKFDFDNPKHKSLEFSNSILYSNVGKKVDNLVVSGADYNNSITDILDLKSNVSVDLNNSSNSVDFPISREEFYVVPFLIGLLIFLLFFRWLYPNRGGKDL